MSAIIGALTALITSYLILGSGKVWDDFSPQPGLIFMGLGAVTCIFLSYFSMRIALSDNSKLDLNLAFRGVLIGIVPGCIATVIVTFLLLAVML